MKELFALATEHWKEATEEVRATLHRLREEDGGLPPEASRAKYPGIWQQHWQACGEQNAYYHMRNHIGEIAFEIEGEEAE